MTVTRPAAPVKMGGAWALTLFFSQPLR